MSKDNQSTRIPMRGFSSRIPTPGSNPTSSALPSPAPTSIKKSRNPTNSSQVNSKLTRPTDIGGSLTNFVRPSAMTQKISQITKSSLTNLTSRLVTRQFSSNNEMHDATITTCSNQREDDQMLIDETIDLVGSDDNVNRMGSRENFTQQPAPNATFDLCRRDGTFIKSPTRSAAVVGSLSSLADAKDAQILPSSMVSKSRDSLNVIAGNQTRIINLRKSGNDLMGSTLSLTKSPEWASTEDMLNATALVFNSTMVNNRLVEVTPSRPFMNISMDSNINATKMLCLTSNEAMEVDDEVKDAQKRYSFGLDITECTLDCSIELCETFSSTVQQAEKTSPMEKQGSYDVDESLGILTPDQMKEFLDSTNTNHTNLDLPLIPGHKLDHQCRVDQTPSPEELPLDPVGVKMEEQPQPDPKQEMIKSTASKVSNSIITSITSITSLDTGYIGDGEMSRPASRGAADQSPSKAPRNPLPVVPPPIAAVYRQRQDPMTDSDFFTESDADDIIHQREKQRRAQVIDGQLYGAQMNFEANLIQRPAESDSAMESSGIFTDVENRGDDYLLNRIAENANEHQDLSPDLSSDTITSNGTAYSQKKIQSPTQQHIDRPREFLNETSSSICSMMDGCVPTTHETVNLISPKSLREGENDASGGSSIKKVTSTSASKKLNSSSRKSHKNETNSELKMSSKSLSSKRNLNGKWEPVMNKIAENKNVKKKFDNVKSKVTCGVVKKNSNLNKTPPSEDHSLQSLESTGAITKKGGESSAGNKRGRAYSSEQSSQSDISLHGTSAASPKIIKSSTARVAKKRDVRTISSSPSDLGPPSKTVNGTPSSTTNSTPRSNSRNITVLQKRSSPQQQQNATNPIGELKGSPPAKKIVPRRLPTNASPLPQEKLSHKDRLVTPSPINASPRSSVRSSKTLTPPANGIIIDALSVSPKSKVKELENNNSVKIINKNSPNVSKMQKEQMLQQIIDQQTAEQQKQMMELLNANKSVEALGVLVQHLVFNLDAFSCPSLKKSQHKTTKQLREARDYIDEMKTSYHSLEEKLSEREAYFNKRECEMQEFHRIEMTKVKKSLDELQHEKRSQEQMIVKMQNENEEKLRKLTEDAHGKLTDKESELQTTRDRENELVKRVQDLTLKEDELRDKFHSSELEFSEKLQHASLRERELLEKISHLTKLLEELKIRADDEKRELEEKLNLSVDELSIYKNTRNASINESFQNKTLNSSQILQDEVESLRCVLELKQSEISDLRKTNCELQRAADEASSAQIKCSGLESRVEDLQVQLHAKNEDEKELLKKLKQLQDQHDSMQKKSARLSLHNEELQWRLKQNAERYSHTINELSKSYHEQSSFMSNRTNASYTDGSFLDCAAGIDDDQNGGSPPASPIIKGVVEKSDSVSWVLEMDDETPEVLATRMVRRAGSFRSDKCSPSPVPKRQKCQNNTSIQQSASATSILNRPQSEMSPHKSPATSNGRLRSKSVSASKAMEPVQQPKALPKIVRSISSNNGAVKNLSESGWKHTSINSMKTSSPNPKKIASLESMGDELIIDAAAKNEFFLNGEGADLNEPVVFHRDGTAKFKKTRENRGLITCDTTALTGTESKKHRRPKIHAGEAMISGSNSEDEHSEEASGSSASSTVSTGPSTPSISSSSTTSSEQQPIESIEDALLRWKEHNNTPMEVSWCEEGEPSESCV